MDDKDTHHKRGQHQLIPRCLQRTDLEAEYFLINYINNPSKKNFLCLFPSFSSQTVLLSRHKYSIRTLSGVTFGVRPKQSRNFIPHGDQIGWSPLRTAAPHDGTKKSLYKLRPVPDYAFLPLPVEIDVEGIISQYGGDGGRGSPCGGVACVGTFGIWSSNLSLNMDTLLLGYSSD